MPKTLLETDKDSIRHYKRALGRWLEQSGVTRTDRQLDQETMPKPKPGDQPEEERRQRFRIWLRDSLLWAFEEIEAGRDLYAFRGLLQAAGYAEAAGHDSTSQDAYLILRNLLERTIQEAETGGR